MSTTHKMKIMTLYDNIILYIYVFHDYLIKNAVVTLCEYQFDYICHTMPCGVFYDLVILWQLSKTTMGISIACVHYD